MKLQVRKTFTFVEEVFLEAGQETDRPLRKVTAVAVVANPMAGRYEPDLGTLIEASVEVGELVSRLAMEAMGGVPVESYGKAAVVGLNGEQEHGVALMTTVYGNVLREAVGGGKAWISSLTKRAAPGATIDIPLAHKDALYVRSHYDGMTVTLPDAPLPDEVAVMCCFASRGRLNHRVGGPRAEEIEGRDGLR